MSVFVSQLVDKVIEILSAHGVSERERELIVEAIVDALATRFVNSRDFDFLEIIRRIAEERVDDLSDEAFDALMDDSFAERVDGRYEDIVREEVDAVLRRTFRNPESDD